jgi:5-bromo-4-chloroindolyl phosphate hydrolysis protein
MKEQLIKETGLSEKDIQELRESFIEKYIKLKGWDKESLTSDQLNEIYQQEDYKKPGLLLS